MSMERTSRGSDTNLEGGPDETRLLVCIPRYFSGRLLVHVAKDPICTMSRGDANKHTSRAS